MNRAWSSKLVSGLTDSFKVKSVNARLECRYCWTLFSLNPLFLPGRLTSVGGNHFPVSLSVDDSVELDSPETTRRTIAEWARRSLSQIKHYRPYVVQFSLRVRLQ